jgi:hypothetical protein
MMRHPKNEKARTRLIAGRLLEPMYFWPDAAPSCTILRYLHPSPRHVRRTNRGDTMMKTTTVLAVAVTLAFAAISSPTKVEAQTTGQIINGVIGGIAAGAIISGAVAPAYGPPPGYGPGYGQPGGGCYDRQQVWSSRYQTYVMRNVPVPCH